MRTFSICGEGFRPEQSLYSGADLEQQQRWKTQGPGEDATRQEVLRSGPGTRDFMARCPAGVSRIRCGSRMGFDLCGLRYWSFFIADRCR